MAKAKCLVKFERNRHGGADAVMYDRDGHGLNYMNNVVYEGQRLTASRAREIKALLMRGCAELSRKLSPVRRVPLMGSRRRSRR